jgi:RNA polymerase sigma-70 factor (ECF subfamily)
MMVAMAAEIDLLLTEAKGGADGALGRLLEQYSQYLTLLARMQIGKRLQGKVDAADLVQEVFLNVHRQFPQFRGTTEAEFVAWLRRIMAGQFALTLRRYMGTKGRDVNLERDLVVELDQSSLALDRGLVASYSTPSQHASRREQAVLLAEALGKLSEDHREVIVLRHLETLSFAEVAVRMNRTENSVYKLWVRALANLRSAMGGGQ